MTDASEAARENEAMITGFWVRSMEALVESGIPWPDAAKSMLSVGALQVEAALGAEVAERALAGAQKYMAAKKAQPENLHQQASSNAQH